MAYEMLFCVLVGLANAYLGDEDQGQMSACFIMASLGLFQTD